VLCRAGLLLRSMARLQDVLCRTGGSEFTLICPDTGAEEAVRCGERLRLGLQERSADIDRGLPGVSISVGIALVDQDSGDAEEMLRRAGRSLYRAKSTGRNRVCIWEGS